jgi:hypothetical protein
VETVRACSIRTGCPTGSSWWRTTARRHDLDASGCTASVLVVTKTVNNRTRSAAAQRGVATLCHGRRPSFICLDADTRAPAERDRGLGERIAEVRSWAARAQVHHARHGVPGPVATCRVAKWTDSSLRRGWSLCSRHRAAHPPTPCSTRSRGLIGGTGRGFTRARLRTSSDLRIRELDITAGCRRLSARTRCHDHCRALWGQRMKWQVGTVEDLLRFGLNKHYQA